MRETASFIGQSISGSSIPKVALSLFASALVVAIAIAAAQHWYRWTDRPTPPPLASIYAGVLGMVTGTAGTASAFFITLYVAERNYRRSRQHIPHLNLSISVRRAPVDNNVDTLFISLNTYNNSTTHCLVPFIRWEVCVVSPYTSEHLEPLIQGFDERSPHQPDIEFPWHIAAENETYYNTTIEPGQSVQFVHETLIHRSARAITVSAFVYNGPLTP